MTTKLERFYLEHYPGVDYTPVNASTPTALVTALKALDGGGNGNGDDPPPPPEPRKTRGNIGPHTQAMVGGWRKFLECKPSIFKVMSSMQDCITVKSISPDTLVMWRHFTNSYGDTWEQDDPEKGAEIWVDKFRDSLYECCNKIAQTIPHCPEPYFVVGGPNELVCPDRAVVKRTVNFDIAFIREIAATGLPIAASVLTAPVGNPEPKDFDLVLQLARIAVQYGAYMDYHSYWWANQQVTGIESDWKWHAGRFEMMDDYCREHGVKPRWVFGEMGAVGSEDGKHLNPYGGWQHETCYYADWDRYMVDLIYWDRRIAARNKKYGPYVIGGTVFTVNEHYHGWGSFRILETENAAIAAYLRSEYPL